MSFAAVENPRTGEYGVLRMAAAGGWPRLADGRGWRMAAAGGSLRLAGGRGRRVGAAGGRPGRRAARVGAVPSGPVGVGDQGLVQVRPVGAVAPLPLATKPNVVLPPVGSEPL